MPQFWDSPAGETGVTGFGGFAMRQHLSPMLTTVSIPSRKIGEDAGRVLLERIKAKRADRPTIVGVGYTLLSEESTTRREDAGVEARR